MKEKEGESESERELDRESRSKSEGERDTTDGYPLHPSYDPHPRHFTFLVTDRELEQFVGFPRCYRHAMFLIIFDHNVISVINTFKDL